MAKKNSAVERGAAGRRRRRERARVDADDEGELKRARVDAGSSEGELFGLPVVDDEPQ